MIRLFFSQLIINTIKKSTPYLLAKLRNTPLDIVKDLLENDKAFHQENKLFLEHIWQNTDNKNKVLFLFRIKDVDKTKILINKLHSEAIAQDSRANLPEMTYLE